MNKYTFVTIEKESFFDDFFGERKFGQESREHFDEIEMFLNSSKNFKNAVLLWHLSASGIKIEELDSKISRIKKEQPGLTLKIGKSEDTEFIKEARKINWFDIVGIGNSVKDKCIRGNWNVDKIRGKLLLFKSEEKMSEITNYILHLFLSIDIDMQALILVEGKKATKYFEEMYNDNIDYYQKVNELQSKVRELDEIEGINTGRLNNLVDDASSFFKKLERKEKNLREVLEHTWKTDRVNSFHDWYCELASCLGGAEGCEGK